MIGHDQNIWNRAIDSLAEDLDESIRDDFKKACEIARARFDKKYNGIYLPLITHISMFKGESYNPYTFIDSFEKLLIGFFNCITVDQAFEYAMESVDRAVATNPSPQVDMEAEVLAAIAVNIRNQM